MATKLTIKKVGETLEINGSLEIADFRKAVQDAREDLGEPLVEQFNSLVTSIAGTRSR